MKDATTGKKEFDRRDVLEAAAKLFSERGYGGTKMIDVAKALDVSRPTIYYYFRNKEEILSSLVDEVTVYSQDLAASVADLKSDPIEAFFEMVRNHSNFVLQNPLIFRVIERGENDLDQTSKKISKNAKRALMEKFRITIDRGVESGQFRKVDSSVAALTIIGMCNWSAWWFVPDGRLSSALVSDQIANMALASINKKQDRSVQMEQLDSAFDEVQTALSNLNKLIRRTNN